MIRFQNKNVLVGFGGAQDSFEKTKNEYPELHFKKIKQTHSDIVVEASDQVFEADAHFSSKPNEALIIATADCMPIMIFCEQTLRVAAVHAGWRGVENKIVEKTLNKLISTGSSQKKLHFWVGPHLLQSSFEVDQDVKDLLMSSQYGLKEEEICFYKNNKYYVDLFKIVKSQIVHVTGLAPKIEFLNIDTQTNSDYHSYRRDQKTKERNLSFISLLA